MMLKAHIETPVSEGEVYNRLEKASGFFHTYKNLERNRNVLTFHRERRATVLHKFSIKMNRQSDSILALDLEIEIRDARRHFLLGAVLFLLFPLFVCLMFRDTSPLFGYIFPVPILAGAFFYRFLRTGRIIRSQSEKELAALTRMLGGKLVTWEIVTGNSHTGKMDYSL